MEGATNPTSAEATAPIVTCPNCGRKNRLRPSADDFERELQASVPVVVDFWAPWCGPCKWISPAVAEQARDRAGKVEVVKLDIDRAQRSPAATACRASRP